MITIANAAAPAKVCDYLCGDNCGDLMTFLSLPLPFLLYPFFWCNNDACSGRPVLVFIASPCLLVTFLCFRALEPSDHVFFDSQNIGDVGALALFLAGIVLLAILTIYIILVCICCVLTCGRY